LRHAEFVLSFHRTINKADLHAGIPEQVWDDGWEYYGVITSLGISIFSSASQFGLRVIVTGSFQMFSG